MAIKTIQFGITVMMTKETDTYGGIKEMSVLDPEPSVVGFTRVVSTRVQPSPLKPQLPVERL
jgi:hypothetical protein